MSDDIPNADAVGSRAADWLSTALSIPMIWPKSTAAASVGAILVSVLLMIHFARPFVVSAPPPDARRVAEIREQVRQAEERYRIQIPAGPAAGSASPTDMSDALLNPDHWRKHNDSSSVHAN